MPESTPGQGPAPEVLQPKSEAAPSVAIPTHVAPTGPKRGRYRPSHKATFISIIVVIVILGINVFIVSFVVKKQKTLNSSVASDSVTLSPGSLDKIGINRSPLGTSGTQLVVSPDAKFSGKVQVGGDISVGGQLKLNNKLTASDASLTKLAAGDTSLTQLNVNGNGTVSSLNLRQDLTVAGTSRLQGEVVINKLLTVNNNATITGSLSVGGALSVQNFHANSLTSEAVLTIGGHVITRGAVPAINPGSALGTNGTVSVSGNDAAGTIAVNIGPGGGGGVLASISFRGAYSNIPHVVVTGIGRGTGTTYINRSQTGFSVGVENSLDPGSYAFDYIVMQ